jgi:hypothetical protein
VRCRTQFGLHLLQVLSEREPVKDIQVEERYDVLKSFDQKRDINLATSREDRARN